MQSLDRAVDALVSAGTASARATAIAELEGLLEDCTAAMQVWQEYLQAPGAPGDPWTIVSWVGPQRVKRLHEINLVARERIGRIAEVAGPSIRRSMTMPDDPIEMGYRQLRDGETGTDAAAKAIDVMRERMQHLRGLIERLRTAPPARPQEGAPANVKAPAARKARTGPASPKARTGSTPRKPVPKGRRPAKKSRLKGTVTKLVKKSAGKKRR